MATSHKKLHKGRCFLNKYNKEINDLTAQLEYLKISGDNILYEDDFNAFLFIKEIKAKTTDEAKAELISKFIMVKDG